MPYILAVYALYQVAIALKYLDILLGHSPGDPIIVDLTLVLFIEIEYDNDTTM